MTIRKNINKGIIEKSEQELNTIVVNVQLTSQDNEITEEFLINVEFYNNMTTSHSVKTNISTPLFFFLCTGANRTQCQVTSDW